MGKTFHNLSNNKEQKKYAMTNLGSITLIPYAGLCNRMRAISSAIYVSIHHNVPLKIIWNKSHNCAAHFTDLFYPIDIQGVTFKENEQFLHKLHRKGIDSLIIKPILKLKYDQVVYDFNSDALGDITNFINKEGNSLIKTCYAIGTYYDYNKIFRPIEHIDIHIKQLTSLFSSNTIGVHVRRTDHTISIKESSDDSFFRLMDSELATHPQTNFYLATDDDNVKRKMEEKYGNKIITTHNTPLCRNSVEGMQHAVVDLYCLSRTRKLIGSYGSSYSGVAAEIGKINLMIPRHNS